MKHILPLSEKLCVYQLTRAVQRFLILGLRHYLTKNKQAPLHAGGSLKPVAIQPEFVWPMAVSG